MLKGIDDSIVLSNVKAVESIVLELDLSSIERCYLNRGSAHYPPEVMLRIALYCLLDGRSSPNQWARMVQTCVATRYLARELRPSKATFHRFRDKAKLFIDDLFQQLLSLAERDGILSDGEACIDGTFNNAWASRHRLVNEKTLNQRIQAIATQIENDNRIDQGTDMEGLPKWMAKTPNGRLDQSFRLEEAKTHLATKLEKNQKKQKSERIHESKVVVSTSDPKVPISRDKLKVFGPLWPTQIVTHNRTGMFIAAEVFENATDFGTLGPMIDLTHQNVSFKLTKIYSDSGYTSTCDIRACKERGVNLIGPVHENSYTERNRLEKLAVKSEPSTFLKENFSIDYEAMTCTCPNGVRVDASGDGTRVFANGEVLRSYRFHFSPPTCQACPLLNQCTRKNKPGRSIRISEGEQDVVTHKAKMTPEVLTHCRSVRSQTAEKAFADSKVRGGLRRPGCTTIERTRGVTLLHLFAMNLKRLSSLRKAQEKDD